MAFLTDTGLVRLACLTFAATTLAAPSAATTAAETQGAPDIVSTLPDLSTETLQLGEDQSDRMTMPVEIGGVGPYPFVIDTGSHRSIVAAELAKRLELPALPPVQIVSMAGHETVDSVHLDELSFGSQRVSDLPALSIARDDLGSAGIIGLDGLKDKRLTLNFRKREAEIGRSAPVNRYATDPNIIVVQARSKYGQLILVNSSVDGRRVNVILDTGAEISVGNMALFSRLKQKRLVTIPKAVTMKSVTGTPVNAQFTVVREIHIGSVSLKNVPMVFLDAAPFAQLDLADRPSMLLGMTMLRMFDRVAIDFGSQHVDFMLPESRSAPVSANGLLASL